MNPTPTTVLLMALVYVLAWLFAFLGEWQASVALFCVFTFVVIDGIDREISERKKGNR